MTRVNILVEGQTEETFVNEILGPALHRLGVYPIPRLVGKPKRRGGLISYAGIRNDILVMLKQDRGAYCSTMFDYYRLPTDFPKIPGQRAHSTQDKAKLAEQALYEDITASLSDSHIPDRFLPYIQMHEYEALLFSDPQSLAGGIYRPDLGHAFSIIRNSFPTPEDIDDGDDTAPSKRILSLCRGYAKPLHGVLAAIEIGIETIRNECRHFNDWVVKLEALGRK